MSNIDANEIVDQAIADLDAIENAIEQKGVNVPENTPTSGYDEAILKIQGGGGAVDQTYSPESENAQSGIAVAEALAGLPVKYVESMDKTNALDLFSMESGTYILYGYFIPFPNSTTKLTFSKKQLVSISAGSVSTCVQVFYPPYNAIQYLNIWADDTLEAGYAYERKDAKLYYMEDNRNKVLALDETATDEQYPSAKAVYDNNKVKYIESLDHSNAKNLRDLESGNYVIYGYFIPFEGSPNRLTAEYSLISVYHVDEGSHIFCFEPKNAKVVFIEVLVDETNSYGYTYSRTIIDMLELHGVIDRVETLETQTGDIETALDSIIAIQNGLMGVSE